IAVMALFMRVLSGEKSDALESFARSRPATQLGMAEKTVAKRKRAPSRLAYIFTEYCSPDIFTGLSAL
ncbi:MAG: hypothetical protein ACRD4A_03405, partial [Candidatus Acidiferrales bacterium]